MARGLAIWDVQDKLTVINGNAVLPVSKGEVTPQVVQVEAIKDYALNSIERLQNSDIDNLLND